MFITGVMLMLCVGLCGAIECDLTKQYPVRNNSSGPILKCSNCRECAAGSEPRVPCGETIDIYKSIGDCRPCRNGTYSPNKDTKPCQPCRRNRCFKHQVIEGECVTDKHDASYCLDKCEKGYIMNKEGTACIVDFLTKSTTIPTTIPTTNSTTTKKLVALHDQANKKSRLHPAVVPVTVLVAAAIIFIFVYCCCEKSRETDIRGIKDDEKLDSTDQLMCITNAGKRDETVKFGTEEVSDERNGSPTANGSHSGSTDRLIENNFNAISNTPPQNPIASHIAADINRGLMASTPPPSAMSNAVAFETPVNSPADMFQEPPPVRMAPPQLLFPITPTQSPMYRYVPNNASPGLWRFDDKFPFEMYNRICETFDYGPDGKNWKALVGWLKLNCIEFKRIANKEYKTHDIIQIWAAEDGNGVDKFIQILIDNKVTSLVGDIKACRPQIF